MGAQRSQIANPIHRSATVLGLICSVLERSFEVKLWASAEAGLVCLAARIGSPTRNRENLALASFDQRSAPR